MAFFCGILLANLLGIEQLKQYSIFNEYFLNQLLYVSVNYNDLLFYIAENRGIMFVLLLVFSVTKFGIPVHFLYIIWNGFSFGIAMVSVIVNFGFKGILVLCAFLLPQYLFYILSMKTEQVAKRIVNIRFTVYKKTLQTLELYEKFAKSVFFIGQKYENSGKGNLI